MEIKGTVKYKIGTKSEAGDESIRYSNWLGSGQAHDELKRRLSHMKGPFRLRPSNGELGEGKNAQESTRRVLRILRDNHPTFVVVKGQGDRQLIIRSAIEKPKIIGTDGTNAVDNMHTLVWDRFKGRVSSFGICSCRSIVGSPGEWSQHAYCNAEDIHGTAAVMQAVANFLVHEAGRLNVENVIYNRRIWNAGQGWHAYTGENPHTDHVHVDFHPAGSGNPDCN